MNSLEHDTLTPPPTRPIGRPATGTLAAHPVGPSQPPVPAPVTAARAVPNRGVSWKRVRTTLISLLLHLIVLGMLGLFVLRTPRIVTDFFTTITERDTLLEPIVEHSLLVSNDAAQTDHQEAFLPNVDLSTTLPMTEVGSLSLGGSLTDHPQIVRGMGDLPSPPDIAIGMMTTGRMSKEKKKLMLQKFGGDDSTEAAVALGLKWLANHQLYSGAWTFAHSKHPKCGGKCSQNGSKESCLNGATGLALLAFLAGGHTPDTGDYRAEVKHGFEFLLRHAKEGKGTVDLRGVVEHEEGMYVQGICTIALCECAAMTRDPKIRAAAQGAINFIVKSQDPVGGGWRYRPRQAGDTSVVGWQVMALKSANNCKLEFPRKVWVKCHDFLDSVQFDRGARYGYLAASDHRPMASGPRDSLSAVGVLSRMYLGWDQSNPRLRAGIAYLDTVGPDPNNMYYNYYGTQAMHHWGGKEWVRWNETMKNMLIRTQHQALDGHLAGSWDVADPHGDSGGRLYMTSLAVLTLEIYDRFLPLYNEEAMNSEL